MKARPFNLFVHASGDLGMSIIGGGSGESQHLAKCAYSPAAPNAMTGSLGALHSRLILMGSWESQQLWRVFRAVAALLARALPQYEIHHQPVSAIPRAYQ
jgi:hypothetical protein